MAKAYEHSVSASGISGEFFWPLKETIDAGPSLELPETGGFDDDQVEDFNFRELVSFRRAYSAVSGSPNEELVDEKTVPAENGLSLTVVEDFNLLHIVEVRKMVSRITTRYFHGGKEIEIVLVGTRFDGLRICGHEVFVKLDTDLFLENPTLSDLRDNYGKGGAIRERFNRLSRGRQVPVDNSGTVEATLVERIDVPHPTRAFSVDGNVITIPHVGKLYLAELTVSRYAKSLNMLRWELGCPTGGNGSSGGGKGGGIPPA